MADEITLSDDDDLLNEINQQGTVASVLISQGQPWLRARGSDDSVLPRTRFPLENEKVFDNCQHCNMALSGCVVGGRGSHGSNAEMSLVMSCGHVLCDACKDAGRRTRQEKSDDPPLFECVICKEYGSANLLPGPDGVNQTTCQAAYCTGESFEPPVYRCVPCQRNLCEDCIPMHEQKFPEHELSARTSSMIDPKRAFTGCASHQQPVAYRCDCGEMLCPRCPYNYLSHIPGTSKVQGHKKTKMEEVDLTLEDALEETIGTMSRIRSMRQTAIQKRQELEETTDRVANEVALQFNQIIIQAIQRCFDVLTSLKKMGSTHHSAIEAHLKVLDKTERQLTVGVEMDERARCRHSVKVESVAQYVRNVAYGLCKPAIEQFEQSKEFSSRLEDTQFDLMITAPNTHEIAEHIGKWGGIVMTNAEDLTKPMKEVHILPSKPLDAASIVNAEGIKAILSQEPIDAAEVPLRLHSALEHFTDLYEKRFCSDSMEMDFMTPRDMPFQLGERSPLEAKMSGEEIEARYAYERLTMSRPGMHINHPKIFGGYRRIYNLVQRKQMIQKDVQDTYGRTPCLAPIWMADGNNVAKITPLGPIREQDLRRLQQAKEAAARATGAHSPESGPSPSLAAARNDVGPSPSTSGMQPAQPKPTVLRKKNLVFVKRAPSPPLLQPEAASPPPPQPRPLAYGSAAPSRLGQPNILRRPMPPAITAADGSKLVFRPATSAERVAAGVASQMKAQQRPLVDPAAGQQHRPLRLVPSPTMRRPMESNAHGRPRMYRDTSGRVHVLSAQSPRILPRTSQYQSHQAGPSGGAGRAADNDVKMEFADDELDESMEREERPPIRVDTMRVPGRNQYLDVLKNRSMPGDMPALRFTSDEEDRRITMRQQGYREHEINQVLMRERAAKMPPSSLSNLRVVVPTYRIGNGTSSYRPRFSDGPSGDLSAIGSQPKKRMLPIEPELSRRRGRPAKDDPTAPSNIIAQFRRHTTQWPPKFDEMDATEIEQLLTLEWTIECENEETTTRIANSSRHSFKSEDEWLLEYTPEEREQLKAAAQEKINGAKAQGQGCFVCQLFRLHDGKPRDWQCVECLKRGRALTPLREGEVIEPPQKKMRSDITAPPPEEDEVEHEEEGEEEESVVDLSVLFPVAPRVERRGRPRKNPKPDEPKEAAQPPKRLSREPKKRAAMEETEPAEEVVMGTTRRGRQIKMPAKLKGHEVSTASTTRRSPSEASEARSESSPFAALPHSSFTTQSTPVRASPKKKIVETPVEMQKQIKEESPEPALPRSAMDAPRRGGRRRH